MSPNEKHAEIQADSNFSPAISATSPPVNGYVYAGDFAAAVMNQAQADVQTASAQPVAGVTPDFVEFAGGLLGSLSIFPSSVVSNWTRCCHELIGSC